MKIYLSYNSFFILFSKIIFLCFAEINSNHHYLNTLYVIFPENSHQGGPDALSKSINYMIKNNTEKLSKLCNIYQRSSITLEELENISNVRK